MGRTRWTRARQECHPGVIDFFYPLSTVVLSAALIIVGGFRPRLDIVVVIVVARCSAVRVPFQRKSRSEGKGDLGGPFRAPLLSPLSSYSADSSRRCQFVKCSNSAEWLFYGFKITLIGLKKG